MCFFYVSTRKLKISHVICICGLRYILMRLHDTDNFNMVDAGEKEN